MAAPVSMPVDPFELHKPRPLCPAALVDSELVTGRIPGPAELASRGGKSEDGVCPLDMMLLKLALTVVGIQNWCVRKTAPNCGRPEVIGGKSVARSKTTAFPTGERKLVAGPKTTAFPAVL